MTTPTEDYGRLIVKPALDALVSDLFIYDAPNAAYRPRHYVFTDAEIRRAIERAVRGKAHNAFDQEQS